MQKYVFMLVFVGVFLHKAFAFATPEPVVFGFYAVQCQPVREIVCIDSTAYPAANCMEDMTQAIDVVNAMIGYEIFRFEGVITTLGMGLAYDQGQLIVFGDSLPPHQLAATMPKVGLRNHTACIDRVALVVGSEVALRIGPYDSVSVLVHELMHALGAEHADPRSQFMSRMEPNYQPVPWIVTPADIKTMRAVYGR